MKERQTWTPWICFLLSVKFLEVNSHGRLIEPPSRASMWRYGFNTPPNYNDHELYCGGFTRQYQTNGGKCGICGDAWDAPQPRAHEAGGKYGQGIIVRKYKVGSAFTIRVEVTANHRGFFEFKLCPNNAPKRVATQQCLDKFVLKRVRPTMKDTDEVFHETRYYPGIENKVYEMKYLLPPGLTCSQCVMQWRYIAGNNWGMCANGTGAVGCGPQEEFRACADIAIFDSNGAADNETHDEWTSTGRPSSTEETVSVSSGSAKPETTTDAVDDHENEIPDESLDDIKAAETKRLHEYIIFTTTVFIFALVLVVALFTLLYFYYYHAGEKLRHWRWTGGFGLKEAACWTVIKNKIRAVSCTSDTKKPNQTQNSQVDEVEPIPPPRTKRHSIGFRGVPENLV